MDKSEIRRLIKWGVVALVILLVVGLGVFWLLEAAGIITMNIRREVVQHSQQYVETKVNLLNKLYNDWTQLEAEKIGLSPEIATAKEAQQRSIVVRLKTESEMIPASQVPEDIKRLVAEQY